MKINGLRVQKSKVFGWRRGNPNHDVDISGNPVESNYVVS